MSEQLNSSAIVPIDGEYMLDIKEFDASGHASKFIVKVPDSADFRQWSVMQRVALLKKGPWAKSPIHEILFGIAYAESLGLDIMRGDVYPTGEGRLGIANKAKIKLALATGNIEGIETTIKDTGKPVELTGCIQKTDLECTVTIHVKGWKVPLVRTAKLSRWFKAKNPNWVGNPEHMLELNTVAHACEFVNPTATEEDEAPPLVDNTANSLLALNQAKEAITPKQLTADQEKS
jgi:hypothetical protein